MNSKNILAAAPPIPSPWKSEWDPPVSRRQQRTDATSEMAFPAFSSISHSSQRLRPHTNIYALSVIHRPVRPTAVLNAQIGQRTTRLPLSFMSPSLPALAGNSFSFSRALYSLARRNPRSPRRRGLFLPF